MPTINSLPASSVQEEADVVPIWRNSLSQTARITITNLFSLLLRKNAQYNAQVPIYAPANGTWVLIDYNTIVGDILTVDIRMGAGSCTATFQIADDDGTNATAITGLSGISVTTARQSLTATAARTLLISGTADRQLLVLLASVSGAGPLYIGVRYQRATGAP